MSALDDRLERQFRLAGVNGYEREHQFDLRRRWRLDFAFEADRVAVEVEGGTWQQGRHNYPSGYRADVEKYNALARAGWLLLRVTTDMVRSGEALRLVEETLAERRQKEGA